MKNKILSLAIAGLLLVSFSSTPVSNAKPVKITNKVLCPLIQLSSPPSTLKVGSIRTCANTLTVNTTECASFTFRFTWAGGSYTQTTPAGSPTLSFLLPGSIGNGTTITLYIDDCCGNTSVAYYFTSTTTC